MGDRTGEDILRSVFQLLAEEASEHDKSVALRLWKRHWPYDFNASYLGCDEEFMKLGLATRGPDGDGYLVYGPVAEVGEGNG